MSLGTAAEPDVPRGKILEIRLDETERRIEAWRCLMAISSGLCMIALCIVILAVSIGRGAPPDARAIITLAIAFLIVFAVSRVWGPIILIGFAVISFFFASSLVNNTLGLYPDGAQSASPLAWLMFIAGLAAVFVPVLVLAWRVARTPREEKEIIALRKGRTLGLVPALVAVSGVHPICGELPTLARRISVAALFVLCQSILAFAILVVLLSASTYLVYVGRTLGCIAPSLSNSYPLARCIGAVVGATLWPALWLGVLIGIAAGVRYLARRFSRTSLEALRSEDPRPLILFLRSFSDDQVRLVRPRRGVLIRLILLGEPRPILDHILLEEGTPLGPVVAIGAPGAAPPFGAARTYTTQERWQEVVTELAAASRAIVIAVDDTNGVRWELNEIHNRKYTQRSLHLFPPRLTQPAAARRVISLACASSAEVAALFAPLQQFLDGNSRACIGWYFRQGDELVVLTTARASEVSYLAAVRGYFRSL